MNLFRRDSCALAAIAASDAKARTRALRLMNRGSVFLYLASPQTAAYERALSILILAMLLMIQVACNHE